MADETPKYSINDQLRGLVEQLSAYIETYHGGEVDFVDFDGKVVTVKLGGACLGCPLSPVTVKGWSRVRSSSFSLKWKASKLSSKSKFEKHKGRRFLRPLIY
jgi:Fe-S cluster biogenesis protein NfuA